MTAEFDLDRALADLVEKDRIREVIARFAGVSTEIDVELVRSCFHPDGTFDHGRLSQGSGRGFPYTDRELAVPLDAAPPCSDHVRIARRRCFCGNLLHHGLYTDGEQTARRQSGT